MKCGWRKFKLKGICKINRNNTNQMSSEELIYYIGLEHIEQRALKN